jgi:DNA repair protein RadC
MTTSKNLTIKNWADEDKPREKLLLKGAKSLSDAELIAILIGSGNRKESAVELSKKILNSNKNNLNELGKQPLEELIKFNGIGEAKAISIIASLELGKRRKLSEVVEKTKVSGSQDVYDYMQAYVSDLQHEEFWVLYLNRSNKIIEHFKISQGGVSGTVIDVKIILKNALNKLASSIIICHNHPSGNLNPSDADIKITKKIVDAAKLLDINILDHLIIGDNNYYSFADKGMI